MAKASSQKFIARNRAPRVQIEYDVELYGAEKKIQLPFVMGVLADLSGKPAEPLPPVADRKFLDIDVDNFDSRMKALKPRAAFQVPNTLTGEGNLSVELTFDSMDDFSPAAVASQGRRAEQAPRGPQAAVESDHLHGRQERGGRAGGQAAAGSSAPADAGHDEESSGRDRPDPDDDVRRRTSWQILKRSSRKRRRSGRPTSATSTRFSRRSSSRKTDEAKEAVERAVRTLAEQALSQTKLISSDVVKSIEAIIAQLDKKLSEQINLILHHEDFQKLEGAWRGLHYLVNNTETDEMLKIRFMNISKARSREDAQAVQGNRLGSEPAVQEGLRGGVRTVRRRALRLPGRRLLLRSHAA